MNRRTWIWLFGFFCFWPVRAWAYIMPTTRVVRRIESALKKLNSYQVAGLGQRWSGPRRNESAFGERWIFGAMTQLDVNGVGGDQARWVHGKPPTGDLSLLPPPAVRTTMAMLFGQCDPQGWLRLYRVDEKKQRLALVDDRVCIVIGTNTPSTKSPQLWVDQDTFLPQRMIVSTPPGLVDIQCIQWSGPITNSSFPHTVSIRLNRRKIRKLEVSTVRHKSLSGSGK